MFNPFFMMTILYFSLALLGALDSSLIHLDILSGFAGQPWLRIHFITLGALTEFIFGLLPLLVALRSGLPRPGTRWDTWLALNLGLLMLLIGIPLVNPVLITAGGLGILIAAVTLLLQLRQMRPTKAGGQPPASRKFYIAGLAYLLLGIIVGTGLWQGWSVGLQIKVPLEVHIHANNWGFMSLVFAGLLVDLYPGFAGRPLAWPRSLTPIFWMMTLGALGLVLGPWTGLSLFTVPGLILHLSATIWLLLNVVKPLIGDPKLKTPGILHLVTAYVWILAPVLVAPLILLKVPGFPGAGIEQNAPQALIYGWMLQVGYALIPYLFRRNFLPDSPPQLGGSWLSLITVHLGGILLWAGIFLGESRAILHGAAYALWFISMLPIVVQLWQIARAGLDRITLAERSSAFSESVH